VFLKVIVLGIYHGTHKLRITLDVWLQSESFRSAHKNAGASKWMYIERTILKVFELFSND